MDKDKYKVWTCKVVVPADAELPAGFDSPPRLAVQRVIGEEAEILGVFSGWDGKLDEVELQSVLSPSKDLKSIEKLEDEQVNGIAKARKTMRDAFEADDDFKRTYIDNVACVLLGRIDCDGDKRYRDSVATDIVDLIFDIGECSE